MGLHRSVWQFRWASLGLIALSMYSGLGLAQSKPRVQPPQPNPSQQDNLTRVFDSQRRAAESVPEVRIEETPIFRSHVNQVLMRVVVRDKKGNLITDLQRDDFQIKDNGRVQVVTSFTATALDGGKGQTASTPAQAESSSTPALPEQRLPARYIAYLFDDLHSYDADLIGTKLAAEKQLRELRPDDRAAVFTTSGRNQVDFTHDIEALVRGVRNVHRWASDKVMTTCPWMNYAFADEIINKNNLGAKNAAIAQTLQCLHLDPEKAGTVMQVEMLVVSTARQQIILGEHDSKLALLSLDSIAARMSTIPGQRIIVLASPGYFVADDQFTYLQNALERAVRWNVVIHTLDIRGLYVDPAFDAEMQFSPRQGMYMSDSARRQGEVLGTVAYWTGGIWFHNNNDMNLGFRRVSEAPEFFYTLSFTPQKMKFDGSFHKLSASVKRTGGPQVATRRGYFAPRGGTRDDKIAAQQLEQAFFSQDEIQGLSLAVQTQNFKLPNGDKAIDYTARLDAQQLPFRQDKGKNVDTLLVAVGVFDSDGNYLQGIERSIDFQMTQETLDSFLRTGMTLRSQFKVEPGKQFIRIVIREKQHQLLTAKTTSVAVD
jgi:VWFA-related protein